MPLGLQLFGRRVAGMAAALLAVSPLHVLNSALATLDVPAAFLATLVLLLTLRAFDSERRRDFAWLGVAAGALLGTKITAAIVLVAPVTLLAARPPGAASPALSVLAGSIALAVFAVTTPSVVVHPKDYLAFMSSQHANLGGRSAPRPPLRPDRSGRRPACRPRVARGLSLDRGPGHCDGEKARARPMVVPRRGPRCRSRPRSPVARLRACALRPARGTRALHLRSSPPGRSSLRSFPLASGFGLAVLVLAFAFSGGITMVGLRQRMDDDPRTVAARDIAAVIPHGATLALAPTTMRDPWTGHAWRYPRLAEDDYVLTSPFVGPAYIVTTSYVLDRMVAALAARPEGDETGAPGGPVVPRAGPVACRARLLSCAPRRNGGLHADPLVEACRRGPHRVRRSGDPTCTNARFPEGSAAGALAGTERWRDRVCRRSEEA